MKFTVVCVDDDPLVLASLGEQLRRSLGDEVVELAASGEEALQLCAEIDRDGLALPLVISDQKMPGIPGDRLLAQIRQLYPETLTILLTGQSSLEDVVQAVNSASLYRYIAKPWDETDLLLTVKEAIRAYFQTQQIAIQQREITKANQRLNQSLVLLQATLEATVDGILAVDNEGKVTHYNHKALVFWDLIQADEVDTFDTFDPGQETLNLEDRPFLPLALDKIEDQASFIRQIGRWHQPFTLEGGVVLKLKNGRVLDCYSQAQRLGRRNVGRVWSFHDITEKVAQTEVIEYQAHYDDLTGLNNRAYLEQRLDQALDRAEQLHSGVTLLSIDLHNFQTINEQLGYIYGDLLLQVVAQRLQKHCQPEDTLARWSGDKFILIHPHALPWDGAEALAQAILQGLQSPYELYSYTLNVTASIGSASYPTAGIDGGTLIQNADLALAIAQNQDQGDYQAYTPTLQARIHKQQILESSFHQALEQGEFTIRYQPQVDTATGAITHMEATCQWDHPTWGTLDAELLQAIATQTSTSNLLGDWILGQVCHQAVAWQALGLKPLVVTVNLWPQQFWRRDLLTALSQILDATGLAPQYLELEVAETLVMENHEPACQVLQQLQQLGVQTALDDFGTGYSSLRYLKQFPLHTLKINAGLIADLRRDPYYIAIVHAVLILGYSLGLRVVAQGVESAATKHLLHGMQCHHMQGPCFDRPLTVAQATQVLQQNSHQLGGAPPEPDQPPVAHLVEQI